MSRLQNYFALGILLLGLTVTQSVQAEVLIINLGESHVASSCTIFTATFGDTVLFGNNEDYKLNNAYRWYVPAQNVSTTYFGEKSIYGAVFFGFDNNDYPDVDGWEQGGMNEYGLCYDANGLPDITLNLDPSAQYPYTSHAIAQSLWDCKNVEEVIAWYKNIKWSGSLGGQFHYADSTGDAVVVSVNSTGQWVFTRISNSFLVSTNFNLNDTTHGYYPCNRYETAIQMLSEINNEEDLNVSVCADILYSVHQEGTYATKYSNICDPVNLEFYFNSGNEFSEQEKFGLTAILADESSFEEKNSFLGVYGVDGGILVKTEKIDIQFSTNTTPKTDDTNITLIAGVIGVSFYATAYTLFKRRRI